MMIRALWPATQTHTTAGIVPEESRESALQICEDIVLWMTQHSRILHRKKPKRKAQEIERDVLRLFVGKSSAYARGALEPSSDEFDAPIFTSPRLRTGVAAGPIPPEHALVNLTGGGKFITKSIICANLLTRKEARLLLPGVSRRCYHCG